MHEGVTNHNQLVQLKESSVWLRIKWLGNQESEEPQFSSSKTHSITNLQVEASTWTPNSQRNRQSLFCWPSAAAVGDSASEAEKRL